MSAMNTTNAIEHDPNRRSRCDIESPSVLVHPIGEEALSFAPKKLTPAVSRPGRTASRIRVYIEDVPEPPICGLPGDF